MEIDFSRLRVQKLIVHEIPEKTKGNTQKPILSTIETLLSEQEKRYFTRKITDNLSLASFAAKFMSDAGSPIPQLIVNNFFGSNNHDGSSKQVMIFALSILIKRGLSRLGSLFLQVYHHDFVKLSQQMAQYLYDCQTRVNSSGLLAVIEVSIAKQPALAILKLEKEEGMRIEQNKDNGEVTFDVEYISNILLSQNNKVFKAALFILDGNDIDISKVVVYISDNQNRKNSSAKVADFFLKQFLGCELRDNPNVLTQKFFEQTEKFINNQVDNPEEKAKYYLALSAELNSNNRHISPEDFCDKYFDIDKKYQYLDDLKKAGVPTNEFTKNTELIDNHLSKVQMVFDSGIMILSPSTAFQEELKLSGKGDGQVHIEI